MNTVKYWILALTVLLLASCVQEVMVKEDVALPIAGKWAMVDDDMQTSEYIVFEKGEFTSYRANSPRFVHDGFIMHSTKADFTQREKARYSIESGRIIINDKSYAISVKDDNLVFNGNKYVRFKEMDPNRYFSIGIASDDKDIKFGYAKTTDTLLVVVKNESPKYKLSATTEASWINDIKYSEGNLSFTIDKSTEDRSSTILLQYFDAEDVIIKVTQAVDRFINLDWKNANLTYNSQDYVIPYKIDNPIEDALPSVATTAEWIKDITVSGTNVSFHVTENPGSASRSATIYFNYEDAHSVEFSLTQQAAVTDFTVTQTDLDIDYHGGQLSFGYYISNPRDGLTLSVLSVNDWIQVVSTDNNVVKLNVAENNSSGTRMGYITASYGSWVNKVNITQSHSAVKLVVSNTVVNYAGGETTIPVTIDNPRAEGVLTAVSSQAWVSSIAVSDNNVSCNIAANTTGADREAIITMTYKVGNSVMATKEITVSQPAPIIIVDKETLKYAYTSSYQKLTITSNCEWNITSSEDWLFMSQASSSGNGFVNIAASANTTGADRTATITVSNATYNISRTISVSQPAPYIKLSESELTPNYGTESMNVLVDANVAWTATAPSWITVTPSSGSTSGTIKITPAKNEGTEPRTGTVTVAAASYGISKSITVVQKGFISSWNINDSSDWDISLPTASTTKRVIRTNFPITVESSDPWLTASHSIVQPGETELILYASNNTSNANRNATLTLSNTTHNVSQTISVSQVAKSFSFSSTSWDITTADASSTTLTIETNIPFSVVSDSAWLTADVTNIPVGTTTITINAAANPYSAMRVAMLDFINDSFGVDRTILIQQLHMLLATSKTSWDIESAAASTTIDVESTASWAVTKDVSWLTVSTTSGTGDGSFTISATANESGEESRVGKVTVSNPASGASRIITVTQNKAPASISLSSSNWSPNCGKQTSSSFTITSNVSWTASSSASWLTVSKSSGTAGSNTLTLSVTGNNSTSSRSATVSITDAENTVTRTITVTQYGYTQCGVYLSYIPIDLGITIDRTATYTFVLKGWSSSSSSVLFGLSATSGSNTWRFYKYSSYYYFRWGSTYIRYAYSTSITGSYRKFVLSNYAMEYYTSESAASYTWRTSGSTQSSVPSSTETLKIGNANSYLTFKSLKVQNSGGTTTHNFIGVQTNGTTGVFDTITGTFIAGGSYSSL